MNPARGTYVMYCNFYLFRACYVHFAYRTTSAATRFNASLAYILSMSAHGERKREREAAFSRERALAVER